MLNEQKKMELDWNEDDLYKDDYISLLKATFSDNKYKTSLRLNEDKIVILPYVMGSNDIPEAYGSIQVFNFVESESLCQTAVTDFFDENVDESIFDACVRILEKYSGFTVDDENRWLNLGKSDLNDIVTGSIYFYAVDIIGIKQKKTTELKNEFFKFEMINISEITTIKDIFLTHAIYKMFLKKYAKVFVTK